MTAITRTVKTVTEMPSAISWVLENATKGLQAGAVVITLGRETRSTDQNSRLWPSLQDVASQVDWYGNKLSKEDWKDVFSAAWKRQNVVPGLDGGFVVMGIRTSKMSKSEFSELLEIIYAFGAEKNVKWSEKAIEVYESYREAKE